MWSIFKKIRRTEPAEPSAKTISSRTAILAWLEQEADSLLSAIDSLRRLMEDPILGGPGFLTVQLGKSVTVSCQYPNISESLYRAALQGTAADLLPAELLSRGLRWEAESGTVLVLTLEAAPLSEDLQIALSQLHSRSGAVQALAGELSRRCPDLSVRPLTGYILLTPPTPPAPSHLPASAPDEEPDSTHIQ